MTALAQRLAALEGWRRYLLASALGGAAAAALPPAYLLPVLPLAFTGLVWLLDGSKGPAGAFAAGWWFGFGHFLAGLYWVGHAFLVDAETFAWMMPFALAGLAAGLALFPGLAALAVGIGRPSGVGRILVLAAAWTLGEWLRGWIFTGLPWNLLGYVWTLSDAMSQAAALGGVYGLSLLTVLAAAMPAVVAEAPAGAARRWRPVAAVGALLLLTWAGGLARLGAAEVAEVPDVRLRLVQANIDQREKWRADLRDINLLRHLELSASPGWDSITHVIWPETAAAFFLGGDAPRRRLLAGVVPPQGLLITGAPRRSPRGSAPVRLWNSLYAIDAEGNIRATYDKFHLVPFGESLPLRPLLERLGIAKLAPGAVDFSPGPGPVTLELAGLPALSPLICYEAIFADQVSEAGQRPGWLLNITNDAWFGISSGPYQHFAMARLRAVEQGVPLVRAAGTGISGVIDPYGRTIARLGLGTAGVLDSALPEALDEAPPYARLGDGPLLLLSLIAILAGGRLGRRR